VSDSYEYDHCDSIKALEVDTDGVGNAYALTFREGESCDHASEHYYGVVTKLNTAGTILWSKSVENVNSIAVDASGNFYVAGNNDTGYSGCEEYIDNNPPYAQIVSKYNSSGTRQWTRSLTVGTPTDVTVSSSGSIYVVGTTGFSRYSSAGVHTWTKPGNFEEVAISGSNLYTRYRKDIRKYDGNGKQLWLKSQSGLNTMVFQHMDGDGSGNVYLSGKYDADSSSNLNMNAMVRKLNSSGSVLWTKTYGTSAYDDARGVATYDGSEIYTTGETQGVLSSANNSGSGGYLRKFSSSGGTVWTR